MTRNILFLCHRLPYPPNKGDKIRSYALLRHLAGRGKVALGCFIDEREDLDHLDTVRDLAGGACHFEYLSPLTKMRRSIQGLVTGEPLTAACFGSRRLQAWVNRTLQDVPYDDVVIFGSAMAPYLLQAALPGRRVMFDMVDVDSDKWTQYAAASSGPMRWIYAREARSLEQLERAAAGAFGKTLLVSPYEAETFRQIAPASAERIGSLTNGVDLDQFSPGNYANPFAEGEQPVVMTGRMDYRPNHEGAVWFVQEILPRLLERLPQARVYFVGACPPPALQKLAGPNVVVTGRVDDVRPYLQHAGAVVAPLRIARGVQNKVLEAMAMAKPVVATYEATRSLAVSPGNDLWVENDPVRFAGAVLAALQSPDRNRVAQNGYSYVKRSHNWSGLLADFERELATLRQPPAVPVANLPGKSASREHAFSLGAER